MAGTEVGKGYVEITADTNKLQTSLGGLGAALGSKFGAAGQLLGGKLGGGIDSGLGSSKGGIAGIAGMLADTGPWGVAAAAAVASAAAIGAGLYKLGSNFESAYRTIARQTGATGSDLDALKKSFNDVAKSGPSSFNDVATALIEVQRYTGPTGKTLDSLSQQFLTLSRITGTDVSSNVDAGVHALERWNISAAQAPKAMDALFTASQKSGVSFSDLASQVTTFAPQLETMGFGFQQSVSMLASFGKAGVNGSRVMAAFQIGAAKLAKSGAKDIPDALQNTISAIQHASSETDALNIATSVFGSRGAVQMVNAIRSGKTNFDEMSKSVANSNDSIQTTAKRTQTLGGSFGTLKNATAVAFQPLSSEVFNGINKGLISVTKSLVPVVQQIGVELPGILSAIGRGFSALGPTISATFKVIGPLFKVLGDGIAVVADLLQGKWGAAWTSFTSMLRAGFAALEAVPAMILESVTQPIRVMLAVIGGTAGQIGASIANVPNVIGGVFSQIAGTVAGALTSFWAVVTAIPGQVLADLAGLGSAVFFAIAGGFSAAVGGAAAGIAGLWGWVAGTGSRIIGAMGNLGGSIFFALAGGFSAAVGGASAGIAGLWGFVAGIPGRIIGAMGDIGTQLYDVGYRIIGQFASGISAAVGQVTGAIGGVLSKLKSFLPFSPAKEGPFSGSGWTGLYQSGQAIVGQVAAGVSDGQVALTSALALPSPATAVAAGGSSGGPAVLIQEANFYDAADIQTFMRQAAWVAQTQKV